MARNQFGAICDICGKFTRIKNEFYRLSLPTYESELGNSLCYKDLCFNCYYELKQLLKEHYFDKEGDEEHE